MRYGDLKAYDGPKTKCDQCGREFEIGDVITTADEGALVFCYSDGDGGCLLMHVFTPATAAAAVRRPDGVPGAGFARRPRRQAAALVAVLEVIGSLSGPPGPLFSFSENVVHRCPEVAMRRRKRRWGIYAASRGTKIFGRLDCPSGRAKIKKENRVFFADWDEAIEFGCRPCKVCRPDIPRVGDVLTLGHPVFGKPYIALWKTSPRPYRNKPQVCFYSALMYTKLVREKHIVVMQQINLEEWLPFPTAAARAVAWGKRLGITVLRPNGMVRDTVLWVPTGRRTAAQGRAYREVTQRRGLTLVTPTIR